MCHVGVLFAALAGVSMAAQEPAEGRPIRVAAAASLVHALPALSEAWRAESGLPIELSYDASSRIATQIDRGAPVDVFLSADENWTHWLAGRGRVDATDIVAFAGNRLALVSRGGSGASLSRLDDLPGAGLRIALAGEHVPAGRYAEAALRAAGVWDAVEPDLIRGGSVLGVIEWVRRGEADAGLVYASDAARDQTLTTLVSVPEALHRPIRYTAAPLRDVGEPAREFVEFLASPGAMDALSGAGLVVGRLQPGASDGIPQPQDRPGVDLGVDLGSAVRLSVTVAFLATLLGLVPAVALGWLLARVNFRGKALLTTGVLAPLVLPPVVTGYLLLSILGREGVVGRWLGAMGVQVSFTLLGAVLAAMVAGFPLYVLAIRTAFEGIDARYEEVAATLGETPLRSFLRVSLPLARPGIIAGAVLAFARGLGEFGATIVLAGNLEGATRTIPLAVYTLLESPGQTRAIWALVGASVALSLAALAGYEWLLVRQRARLGLPT